MTAVFNAPDRGDSAVANQAKTSDTPQFDLKTLYSGMDTTGGAKSANRESAVNQLDFGVSDNLYSATAHNDNSLNNGFNFEQQGAMDIARHFASFDSSTRDNTSNLNFDREDAGRLIEVYGDMFNAQSSMQDGKQSDATNWMGEMRRDLAAFARGLFDDSNGGTSEEHHHGHDGGHHSTNTPAEDSGNTDNGACSNSDSNCQSPATSQSDGGDQSESGGSDAGSSGENSGHGTDSGSENGSEQGCENTASGDSHGNAASDGYTPDDSMVLIMNDMQELSQALASGDSQAAQQVIARLNRHMSLLMRQMSGQSGDSGAGGQAGSEDQTPTDSQPQWWLNTSFGDQSNGSSTDNFNPLNPGDLLRNLPQPPNPGDLLSHLPQPPNPGDLLSHLPQPPNPSDLLSKLPSPGDLFNIF